MHSCCDARRIATIVLSLGLSAGPALSQGRDSEFPTVEWSARIHTQAYWFDNESYRDATGPGSDFLIRRTRFNIAVQVNERVSFAVMPSFENARGRGDLRLRDAYLDLTLTAPESPTVFTVRFGQEKRPFSRLELTSSNALLGIERGGGPGLLDVQTNDLFADAELLSHDVGVAAMLSTGALSLHAGIYNGNGESERETNEAKSFGVRATLAATSRLSIGGSVFSHDGIAGSDSSFRNTAFGIDAQWGRPGADGLYALAEVLQGETFSTDEDDMRGITAVAAYHVRRPESSLLYAVEPVVRLDLADPDTDSDDDGVNLLGAGIGLYFTRTTQFRVMLERQAFEADGLDAITGFRTAMNVYF